MATFAFKPYTYIPTAPRSKSATSRRKPASKPVSIFDKLQRIKPSSAELSTLQSAAAHDYGTGELGIQENDIVTNNNENDDDYDLPSIEQLLYTTLQKESFVAKDQSLKNTAFEVGDRIINERGGSLDDEGLASGGNLSGSPGDPIVLLGDDDSSISEAEVDGSGLRAESAAADEGFLNPPETVIDSTTPVLSNSDVWHDIDDVLETAERLRLVQKEASTSNSTHVPASRISSEPLYGSIGAMDLDSPRARSEATIPCSARPRNSPSCRATASSANQLSHESRLHTGRDVADERGLVDPVRNTNPVDEREQQEEQEKEEDEDNVSSKSEHSPSLQGASVGESSRPLCENSVNISMEAIDPSRADVDLLDWEADSTASMHRAQQRLSNRDPSLATSRDEAVCDIYSDDELNNTEPDEDNEKSRPVKRKQPFSSQNGPMHKKPKRRLQQRSTRQHRLLSKPHRRSLKSHSPQDYGSRVTAMSNTEVRLPSPAPSAPHGTYTDMPSDCYNLGRSSGDILPTLAEVTFRPHFLHCCSFTAVIRDGRHKQGVSFSQVARLIESIGHVGKIDDFTIKPMEQQHSFLLTGFSQHTSSRLSNGTVLLTTADASLVFDDAPSTILQHGRFVDAGALSSEESELPSSDDESCLSDSDSDLSGDGDACSRKRKQGSSTRMNISWEPVDEQRLLAYKKEDKPWEWIFNKFPGRTQAAVRTRWTMVQQRVK